MTSKLYNDLAALLGEKTVVPKEKLALLDPGIDRANFNAALAVAPTEISQIQALLTYCNQTNTPLIPQGGRTGLAQAASGTGCEILLFTDALPTTIIIDPISQVAEVSASATLAALESAANVHGLSAGIDLAARDSATLGGMASTNAGGMEAFRCGTMRQRVLGLEAVLPDSSVLSDLAHVRKCNEGYDLKQLLIGAEGTLGVITALILQLVPQPPDATPFLTAFPDARAALEVLHRLTDTPNLTVLRAEVMWRDFARENAALHNLKSLTNANAQVFVIFEVHDSTTDPTDSFFATAEPFLDSGQIIDVIAAQNQQQADDIWLLREDTMSLGRSYPHALWFDISVPLAHLDSYADRVAQRLRALDPTLINFALGHLGDGNLHYSIASPGPIGIGLAAAIEETVLDGLKPVGGSFSAEHGVGLEKRSALERYGDPGKLALMRQIKSLLDPNNICNPGKVIVGC
ncbi:MAG: FAD-binding oxidoreductase [Rhodobacteraceae bacterium]|nr:FAD-binding oxidoreductase [Paracoccaceae bacterium]